MSRALFGLALLALAPCVLAQQPPTGGAIRVPPAPPAPRAEPEIRIEQGASPASVAPADAVRVVVRTRHRAVADLLRRQVGLRDEVAVAPVVPGDARRHRLQVGHRELAAGSEAGQREQFRFSEDSGTLDRTRVLRASVFGDHRDGFGGGGVNSYFLTWSTGRVDIDTPSALA